MEGEDSTRGLGRSCPQALPPAPGRRSSDQADVAAICQDTPAKRAVPQTVARRTMVRHRKGLVFGGAPIACTSGWDVPMT